MCRAPAPDGKGNAADLDSNANLATSPFTSLSWRDPVPRQVVAESHQRHETVSRAAMNRTAHDFARQARPLLFGCLAIASCASSVRGVRTFRRRRSRTI